MLIHKITLIIAECVARKFGRSIFEQNSILIKKKCNQKCIDRANKQKCIDRANKQKSTDHANKQKKF